LVQTFTRVILFVLIRRGSKIQWKWNDTNLSIFIHVSIAQNSPSETVPPSHGVAKIDDRVFSSEWEIRSTADYVWTIENRSNQTWSDWLTISMESVTVDWEVADYFEEGSSTLDIPFFSSPYLVLFNPLSRVCEIKLQSVQWRTKVGLAITGFFFGLLGIVVQCYLCFTSSPVVVVDVEYGKDEGKDL
jgi:hypothetical protein